MSNSLKRRDFIKKSIGAGAFATLGSFVRPRISGRHPQIAAGSAVDLGVAAGDDVLRAATQSVGLIGGMEKFVSKDSRVGLLPNVQSSHPGTFTNPSLVRAAIRLCRKAGAKEVHLLSWQTMKNWESTGIAQVAEEEGADLKLFDRDEANFKPVPVPQGKALQEARILSAFFNYDAFIDMPVTKDHAGNKFTGTMKNLMGLNSPVSNRTFHKANWQTEQSAIEFLDQCIADLNTVVRPTLCLVDATEFIITNGPFGPGEMLRPKKVVAGVDRVAVDAYCASLWGLKPENIFAIKRAFEHGLGEMRLQNVKIKEVAV
jgi:uncharacterized protein (DUF362 family)